MPFSDLDKHLDERNFEEWFKKEGRHRYSKEQAWYLWNTPVFDCVKRRMTRWGYRRLFGGSWW